MIRVAILADTHADETRRWEEHGRILSWCVEDFRAREVGLVLHSGDVYEGESTPLEREFVADFAQRVADRCPLVIDAGNHDRPRDIRILSCLRARHPIVADETPRVHVLAGVAVANLPWPRKAHLLRSIERTASPAETSLLASDALRSVVRGLGVELAEHAGPRMLNAHAMIDGARTNHEQPLVGLDMAISASDLALSGAHFVAVGHVHAQQEWLIGETPVVYPGAPMHRDWGQPGPTSYLVVDFDESGRLLRWERVPTPARQMILGEATWSSEGPGWDWAEGAEPLTMLSDVTGAEIRFRYGVPADERDAARREAEVVKAHLLSSGAHRVEVEERTQTPARTRAPEITTAKTLPEQLETFWASKGVVPPEPRRTRLLERLGDVELATGVSTQRHGSAALRYRGLRGRDMGPFRGEFALDLDVLAGPIVAVCGDTGAGKSTLLEFLQGALDRKCPTRGKLTELATSRESYIESRVVNGATYTVRQTVDAVTGGGESLVLDAAGASVLSNAKRSTFDAWRAEALPSSDLIYASTFAAQERRGILSLSDGELKALLLRVSGTEAIEAMAKMCRERAANAKGRLDIAAARLADERGRAGTTDLRAATAALDDARAALAKAEEEASSSATWLVATRAEAERATAHNVHVAKARAEVARASADRDAAERTVQTIDEKLASLRHWLLDQADAIRAAETRVEALGAEEIELREKASGLGAEWLAAQARQRDCEQRAIDTSRAHVGVQKRIADEGCVARNRTALKEKLNRLPELEEVAAGANEAVIAAEESLRIAEETRARLADQAIVGAEGRIDGLRSGLVAIRDFRDGPAVDCSLVATGALARDDKAVADARRLPKERDEAARAIGKARVDLQMAKGAHAKAIEAVRALTRVSDEICALPAPDPTLPEALAAAEAACAGTQDAIRAARVEAEGLALELQRVENGKERVRSELDGLGPLVARVAELDGAEALRNAYEADLVAAHDRVDEAVRALSALPSVPDELPVPRVDAAEMADRAVALRAVEARARVTEAERIVQHGTETKARIDALVLETSGLQDDVSDWTRLGQDVGRDGLQSLLVDGTAAAWTAHTNELLHGCVGPRWTASVDTQRIDADGKRMLEDTHIRVIDSLRGRDAVGSTLSGGERAIVNEALSLALAIVQPRESGQEVTLIRDETSAPLDPTFARAYVAMLRKAAGIVGAAHVLFVSHHQQLHALADTRVRVANGTITVEAA